MLSVEIHKDLTRYRAKVAGGLTARTMACIACAIGASVAVGCYSWLVLGIPFDDVSWAAYACSLPFWALGFWRPLRMGVEEWLPLWWRHNAGQSRLAYDNSGRYLQAGLIRPMTERDARAISKAYRKCAARQRGIELWEPRG